MMYTIETINRLSRIIRSYTDDKIILALALNWFTNNSNYVIHTPFGDFTTKKKCTLEAHKKINKNGKKVIIFEFSSGLIIKKKFRLKLI